MPKTVLIADLFVSNRHQFPVWEKKKRQKKLKLERKKKLKKGQEIQKMPNKFKKATFVKELFLVIGFDVR